MRGCAGAGSTQARTPICTSPRPLARHPGLNLYELRVLSNSDRAPVLSSYLFFAPSSLLEAGLVRTRGASLGLGVARDLWFSSDGALNGCFQS